MGSSRPPEELWDAEQLAQYLGVTRRFVYRITNERRIDHLKVGGSLRFTPEAVAEFLERSTILARPAVRSEADGGVVPSAKRLQRRPRRTARKEG